MPLNTNTVLSPHLSSHSGKFQLPPKAGSQFLLPFSPQGKNHPLPMPPPPPLPPPQTKPLGIPARPLPISEVRLPVLDEGTSSSCCCHFPGHFCPGLVTSCLERVTSYLLPIRHQTQSIIVHTAARLPISHWAQQDTSSRGSSCGPVTTPNGWS